MRILAQLATLLLGTLLLGGLVAGCGSDPDQPRAASAGPPSDAPQADFCAEMTSLYDDLESAAGASTAEKIATMKDWAERMSRVGTPEDISPEARAGFEQLVEGVESLPDDAGKDEIDRFNRSLSRAEMAQSDAFDDYVIERCDGP